MSSSKGKIAKNEGRKHINVQLGHSIYRREGQCMDIKGPYSTRLEVGMAAVFAGLVYLLPASHVYAEKWSMLFTAEACRGQCCHNNFKS